MPSCTFTGEPYPIGEFIMHMIATKQAAQDIIAAVSATDSDWTYLLENRGKYWVIAVEDEDGEPLGYL